MDREITIKIQFGSKTALFVSALFFLCFNPKILGSESLTLTTYYPSPYGGYAKLLTTDQTLLARDGGNVGIGTASPTQKLDVNNGNIRSRSNIYWGSKYPNKGVLKNDQGSSIELGGVGTPYIDFSNNTGQDYSARLILSASGRLQVNGDFTVTGRLISMCTSRGYTFGGNQSCGANERLIAFYGDGLPRITGFLPANNTMNGPGTYIALGQDWGGTMLCCRIQ